MSHCVSGAGLIFLPRADGRADVTDQARVGIPHTHLQAPPRRTLIVRRAASGARRSSCSAFLRSVAYARIAFRQPRAVCGVNHLRGTRVVDEQLHRLDNATARFVYGAALRAAATQFTNRRHSPFKDGHLFLADSRRPDLRVRTVKNSSRYGGFPFSLASGAILSRGRPYGMRRLASRLEHERRGSPTRSLTIQRGFRSFHGPPLAA